MYYLLLLEVAEADEMKEHIYYDRNDGTDSLIVLQRSSDGHGNLVTRYVDSGDIVKTAFTSMNPPCH